MLDPDTSRRHLYVVGQTSNGQIDVGAQPNRAGYRCRPGPRGARPARRSCQDRAVARAEKPEQRDNAAPTHPSRRSVEPAPKPLWEHRRQMNAIKDAIKSGRTVVGTTVTPDIDVSMLADAGYDFLLFDTPHSAWE